jgi:hypothetical protein
LSFVTFLSCEKKSTQKKTPVSRLTLRVGDADSARRNSLALKQADALFPSAPPMLGAGQWGSNRRTENNLYPPMRESLIHPLHEERSTP